MSPMLKPNYKKDWLFICSDRVGKDGDTLFNGCSCVIKLQELKLIQCLSKDKEEAILIKTGKYRKWNIFLLFLKVIQVAIVAYY